MIDGELIVDCFAGGGGASTGIEMALGVSPDIAINHDPEALALHMANHPNTKHISKNIWQVDLTEEVGHRPVGLLWASPDCKHFSKAKGGKPVKASIRDLAWTVVRYARQIRPRVIVLENVEEFRTWGPLHKNELGQDVPDPERKGETFQRWMRELSRLGYRAEWRELRACDYGAPTIRKRFFMVARRDGGKIVWPKPTHGDPKSDAVKQRVLLPWRTAAEIIDWSLPCHSIFLTREEGRALGVNRPLADATMARIFKGIDRYVIKAEQPFIVSLTHHGSDRVEPVDEPFKTVAGAHRGEKAVVTPVIVRTAHGERDSKGKKRGRGEHDIAAPLPTVTASPEFAVSNATLVGVGGRAGQSRARGVDEPLATVTAKADVGLAVPTIITSGYGEREGQDPRVPGIDKPLGTVVAGGVKHALVAAHMAKFRVAQYNNHGGDDPHAGRAAEDPLSPVTTTGSHQSLVASHMLSLKGSDRRDAPTDAPVSAITSQGYHVAEVRAFLMKYYGTGEGQDLSEPAHTVTTKDRFGLITVTIGGEEYIIVDIGMRMLVPRELFSAQSFPLSYIIDRGLFVLDDGTLEWRPLTKTAQIRMCGNSVCPVLAQALVAANFRAGEGYVRKPILGEMPLWPEEAAA